jgi:DNA repair ATPase RecN
MVEHMEYELDDLTTFDPDADEDQRLAAIEASLARLHQYVDQMAARSLA